MSWLSSIGNAIGNVAKKVGGVVKTVAAPLASFAVGLIPGVGPLLSKGVDMLGNSLTGDSNDITTNAGQQAANPTAQLIAQTEGTSALQLGSSPAMQSLAAASTESTSSGFLGIGDGKPGVFGIGDGKPGVFGIGTGKAKAKKAAAEAARAQAEDAAKGEGLTPNQIKLKGAEAAVQAEKQVERNYDAPSKDKSEDKSLIYIVLAALGIALL